MCRLCQKKETELPFCRKDYKSFVNTSAKDACGDLTCVTTAPIAVLDEAPVEEVAEPAEGEATSGEGGEGEATSGEGGEGEATSGEGGEGEATSGEDAEGEATSGEGGEAGSNG